MGLREEAIKAYERQRDAFRKESEDRLIEKREEYRKVIVEICNSAFGRDPDSIAIDENGNRFTIEDLTFIGPADSGFYGDKWNIDLGVCRSCGEPIRYRYAFSLWNRSQEVVLASIGDILLDQANGILHICSPPDTGEPAPPKPPQIVTYRIDSVECRLLDSIREYVNDAIEQEREGR